MRQYYFTVSSLPFLRYDEGPVLSLEGFYEACEPWVSPRDYRLIRAARLDPARGEQPTCPALETWRERESALRNELVRLRAQRLNKDPYEHLVPAPFVHGASELAQEAFAAENPLEAEELLLRARWGWLEELELGHAFDVERLVVYGLKVQLLARKSRLVFEKGREQFGVIFDALKDRILKEKISVGVS